MQALADTPLDSQLRFKSRAILPSYAKRLRDVGPAVNALIESQGIQFSEALSSKYGGAGAATAPADLLLQSIGSSITLSGRCCTGRESNAHLNFACY